MQLEFMRQYEHYQEMINQCYPGANIKFAVETDEILDIFSHI